MQSGTLLEIVFQKGIIKNSLKYLTTLLVSNSLHVWKLFFIGLEIVTNPFSGWQSYSKIFFFE